MPEDGPTSGQFSSMSSAHDGLAVSFIGSTGFGIAGAGATTGGGGAAAITGGALEMKVDDEGEVAADARA
jgi:hypothetical protein